MSAIPQPLAQPAKHKFFSISRVSAIASNTLLELVRLKVFYFLLLFGLLVIGSSLFLVKLSFQEQFQAMKDFSLGAMQIFSWLLAVLATAMLLPKDLEDRTLYTILAKPVPRSEYLFGKLLGVFFLLAVSILLMSSLFLVMLYFREQTVLAETMQSTASDELERALADIRRSTFNFGLFAAIVSIFIKSTICASLTLLISTFATSWIFTIFTSMMVFFAGHLQAYTRDQWLHEHVPSLFTKLFLMVVALVIPDLQVFSIVDDIVAGTSVPVELFWRMVGLGLVYDTFYLLLGCFLFSQREL